MPSTAAYLRLTVSGAAPWSVDDLDRLSARCGIPVPDFL